MMNYLKIKKLRAGLILAAVLFSISACATVGQDFPDTQLSSIQMGITKISDIRQRFGQPWRVGVENSLRTWTYGQYKYSLFSAAKTKDLVVRFNPNGTVASYAFNTTEHQE